jgi:sortase A
MFRNVLERMLWSAAVVSLAAYAFTRTETWLYQSYLDWQLSEMLTAPVISKYSPPSAALRKAAMNVTGRPVGRLEILSIGLAAVYIEGADDRTLRRGVGHVPGTAMPGEFGNAVLSGHRDTFFRPLEKIRYGDRIRILTLDGSYDYRVEAIRIVDPDEGIVIRDFRASVLTLVTCYPFWSLGPAPKRFVVHATLINK